MMMRETRYAYQNASTLKKQVKKIKRISPIIRTNNYYKVNTIRILKKPKRHGIISVNILRLIEQNRVNWLWFRGA